MLYQIKLDELIRAVRGAQNSLIDLEELDEIELDRIRDGYEGLARQARERSDRRAAAVRRKNGGKTT